MEKQFIFNLESTKIELHFQKDQYMNLSEEDKKMLKGAFLFSKKNSCWVSRAKEPNLYRPKEVAKKLGFTSEERQGERISFAQQLENKSEKAEARAERYETYSESAKKKGQIYQKDINEKHGDISFFTQPIIPGHSGSQRFARQREKMFDRYRKGFEEYRKSAYFKEKAMKLKDSVNKKLEDKGFINRRIEECKTEIRKRERNLIEYENILSKIENGENPTRYGKPYSIEEINQYISRNLELIEVVQDKEAFYHNCMEEIGGVLFNKDNVNKGDVLSVMKWDLIEVTGKGSKNVSGIILEGGAKGHKVKVSYAEIIKKIEE